MDRWIAWLEALRAPLARPAAGAGHAHAHEHDHGHGHPHAAPTRDRGR